MIEIVMARLRSPCPSRLLTHLLNVLHGIANEFIVRIVLHCLLH